MKTIIKALTAFAVLCCSFFLPLRAEEAGETAEQLNAKYYAGTQFAALVPYMQKYGSYQTGNYYLYRKNEASGYEIYVFYHTNENKLGLYVNEWGTDSKYDSFQLKYSAETLAVEYCRVTLRRGRSSAVPMLDKGFNVKTFTQETFNEQFVYETNGTSVSYQDGIAANNFLRKSIAMLDNYFVSTAAETKVLSLDELGFSGIGYLKSIRSFVERLYLQCLGRQADRSGLVYWVMRLYTRQTTAAECVRGFFMSTEMKNRNLTDKQFVTLCYEVMIGRSPDSGGLNYWVEHLENGVSWMYILKGFTDSREFANICENYGVTQGTLTLSEARDMNYGITSFTARCYRYVLDRKFDVTGLNNWCRKILDASNKKKAAVDMATNGFFHSVEFLKKNTSNELFVAILYRTFLNRDPDTGGFTNWLNKLKNGASRDSVMMGFANSAEFAKLMASYGIS